MAGGKLIFPGSNGYGRDGFVNDLRIKVVEGDLDDEAVLAAMSERAENVSGDTTVSDVVSGVVASRIMKLRIPDGTEILLPVMALLQRTGSMATISMGSTGYPDDDGTMAYLALSASRRDQRPSTAFFDGLRLGDRATIYAVTGKGALGTENPDDARYNFARGMARSGYRKALANAERTGNGLVKDLSVNLPPLVDRFDDVAKVVRGLFTNQSLEL